MAYETEARLSTPSPFEKKGPLRWPVLRVHRGILRRRLLRSIECHKPQSYRFLPITGMAQ